MGRDNHNTRHEYDCRVCKREGFHRKRVCFQLKREAIVHVPVIERGTIIPNQTRPRLVDEDGALDIVEEIHVARQSTRVALKRDSSFELLHRVLNVCPAAYQFDGVTQEAVRIASLRGDGAGYPVHDLPAWFTELVGIAGGANAEYMDYKFEQRKKQAERKGK